MGNSHCYEILIALSGGIGAGKTTIAKALASAFCADYISFGEFVRYKAAEQGIESTRENLQTMGQELLTNWGVERFVREVFEFHGSTATVCVLDGVRHIQVWNQLKNHSTIQVLVHIDANRDRQIARVENRDHLPLEEIVISLNHPMEEEALLLRNLAHVVFDDVARTDNCIDMIRSILARQ